MKQRHKWSFGHCRPGHCKCVRCGITRKLNAKYKGRFDYLINGVWDFRPITPACVTTELPGESSD